MPKPKSWQLNLFYLILFLIPCNLAKHFILPSSYVSGILVDYLIPTIYITDILIIILLGSELQQVILRSRQMSRLVPNLLFFPALLLPLVIFASSPIPALYKYLKILLLILFSIWIKQNINLKKHSTHIINTLSASVLFQSLLALTQWFKQSSVFNYLPFGIQPYNSATPNIDKITWFTGAIKIPPMGTFPHPNVLAGFLAVILPLILCKGLSLGSELSAVCSPVKKSGRKIVPNLLRILPLFLGLITLFLTFSLSAWLAFLLIGLPLVLKSHLKIPPKKFIFIYSGLFLILFSFATSFTFLAPASSFSRRSQLTNISLKMIKDKPIFGVGLNNFTINMESYGHVTATTRFLQPVHNIYLLILSETGLIGFLAFIYLIGSELQQVHLRLRRTSELVPNLKIFWIPLLTLLFLGLFDHYPLTIHQGLLLFFIFLPFI
ncbi:MAG: O-antigen ligase family protein [Candidatus Beckwithbacteria bacterium]